MATTPQAEIPHRVGWLYLHKRAELYYCTNWYDEYDYGMVKSVNHNMFSEVHKTKMIPLWPRHLKQKFRIA